MNVDRMASLNELRLLLKEIKPVLVQVDVKWSYMRQMGRSAKLEKIVELIEQLSGEKICVL